MAVDADDQARVGRRCPLDDDGPCVLFIAESITFASPEHPILVVGLDDKILSVVEFPDIADRAPFRCIPSELWWRRRLPQL